MQEKKIKSSLYLLRWAEIPLFEIMDMQDLASKGLGQNENPLSNSWNQRKSFKEIKHLIRKRKGLLLRAEINSSIVCQEASITGGSLVSTSTQGSASPHTVALGKGESFHVFELGWDQALYFEER